MAEKKSKSKRTNGEKKSRAPRTAGGSFKDVQIAYLVNGVAGVEELYNSGKVKRVTIRRALKMLSQGGKNVSDFSNWVVANFGALARGRSTPSVGELRSYKAQTIYQKKVDKDGNTLVDDNGEPLVTESGAFLRLPLDTLGVTKGTPVFVRYNADVIEVSAAPFDDVEDYSEDGSDLADELMEASA